MLQQTTVAAVTPRFERFIARWPTIEALAAASDEDILSEWAGLGYYARARNLIACAREVARRGAFPTTAAELRKLPGIGAYTAAAIAAIAFGEQAAAVDTNVERVIARLHGLKQMTKTRNRARRARYAPAGPCRRFRSSDDGPRRDHLPAEEPAMRHLSACAAIAVPVRAARRKPIRHRSRGPRGRTSMASLTGSSATIMSGWSAGPPRGCSAEWRRFPGATGRRAPHTAVARPRNGAPCLHPFLARSCDRWPSLIRSARAGGSRSTASPRQAFRHCIAGRRNWRLARPNEPRAAA